MQTMTNLDSRQTDLEGAIIELRRLAEAQAAPRPQRLRVMRDAQGNAVVYRQEPIDVAFEREVEELHRRAGGNAHGVSASALVPAHYFDVTNVCGGRKILVS